MKKTTLIGTVFSGEGKGKLFTDIPWAKKQIKEKLGFTPHPGTLNLQLPEKEAEHLQKILQAHRGIEITPRKGFYPAKCFKTTIMNKIGGALIIPQKLGYPTNVIEIAAPVHLRTALLLKDGDQVEFTIFLNADTNV
jgi:riboflavin kinase